MVNLLPSIGGGTLVEKLEAREAKLLHRLSEAEARRDEAEGRRLSVFDQALDGNKEAERALKKAREDTAEARRDIEDIEAGLTRVRGELATARAEAEKRSKLGQVAGVRSLCDQYVEAARDLERLLAQGGVVLGRMESLGDDIWRQLHPLQIPVRPDAPRRIWSNPFETNRVFRRLSRCVVRHGFGKYFQLDLPLAGQIDASLIDQVRDDMRELQLDDIEVYIRTGADPAAPRETAGAEGAAD